MSNRIRKSLLQRLSQLSRRKKCRASVRSRISFIEPLESRDLFATFAVLNVNDSGSDSLRQAILDANANPGADVIQFNISGSGVHTIQPLSALPTITDPIEINGYTQPGAMRNTLSGGNDAELKIELDGSLAGLSHGLLVTAGNSSVRGLVINNFAHDGIRLETQGGNTIEGNFIGVDPTGLIARGNGTSGIGQVAYFAYEFLPAFGIEIIGGSSDNIIGTNGDNLGDVGERNVISSNLKADVMISGLGTNRNVVAGNFIGTNAAGTGSFGQVAQGGYNYNVGVFINGGPQSNRIGTNGDGTADTAERNIISGHFGNTGRADDHHSSRGVEIANLSSPLTTLGQNFVAGNYIGTDVTGTKKLGNGVGVGMQLSDRNRVGTNSDGVADAAERNLISGNGVGVHLFGCNQNTVSGNYVGTDVTGTTNTGAVAGDLGNSTGIWVLSSPSNTIGGATTGAGNLVSGNTYYGIHIQGNGNLVNSGADGNSVQGNLVGTDATGTVAISNGGYGLYLNSNSNLVGGTTAAARNLISASGNVVGGDGIQVIGSSNTIQGNYIGTDISGTLPLGNSGNPYYLQGNGIRVLGGTGNQIGGLGTGEGNHIAFNIGAGVMVSGYDPNGNAIRGNSIHSNNGLGIDLAPWAAGVAGVTLNDLNDADVGSNDYQNFPLIATVASSVSGTAITGSLNSTPSTTFTLDFYANAAADPSGYGEGRTYLGAATVSTDVTGNVNYSVSVPGVAPVGQLVSATATNPAGSTSEFSGNTVVVAACVEVASLVVTTTSDVVANDCQTSLREAINYANSRSNSLNPGGVPDVITFNIPGAGVQRIQPLSALPNITDAVVIDGYTQPGASFNTLANGDNAVLKVELDGSLAGGSGLVLVANNNTVRGLAINNFAGAGVFLYYSDSNIIAGNFVGTDATGTIARPNDLGIKILAAQDNVVGGTLPADRNVLSGNKYDGINVQGTYNPSLWLSTGNQILGNFAGTDASGTMALPNGSGGFDGVGINIGGGSGNRVVNNLVSGNGDGGIALGDYATVVEGNFIGTDVTGTLPLGNTGIYGNGISVYGVGNQIGGTGIGQANLIAHNAGAGIYVSDVPTYVYPSSSVVSIRGNSIHSNGGLGIDLAPFPYSGVTGNDIGDADIGPNGYQNFPLIASVASSVSGTAITGSFNSTPSTTFTLDFYSNSAADPSGYGEGRTYLGAAIVSTDATGNVNYSVSVPGVAPVGQFVSATATSSSGSTSEFSGIGTVTAHNTSPTNLVLNSGIIDENGTFTLTVSFDDSDLLDNHTVSIHWGEGLPEVHVLPVGARTFSFNHQYLDDNPTVTSSDLYKVTVAITDDRGGSVSTAAGYASTVLADAPILYWRLAESSGTTATNLGSLGSGADGTYTSGPVLGVAGTTADGNTAVRLGDTSDSRVVKSSMAFPNTTVSVEFWEKTTATNNGHPFSYAAGSHDNEFLVAENCSRIYINDALIDTGVNVEDGNWHHFAVTWQSSDGALRVYKDGILAFSGTHQTGATLTSGGTLMLGQDQDSVGGGLDPAQRFIGSMDEVALYNGVLSAAQVQTHYNAAAQVTVVNVAPTNLAWSLNDHDINEGQSTSVSGTFADPGTLDVHTVTINWGDGAPITYTLPVGDRSFNISHQYLDDNPTATPFDNYTVSVSLSDDDSGTGSLAPSLIYGLKSRNGGAVVGSISPTNLYSFSSNGTNFTDIGAVKIGSTNIDADALAYSPTQGLFGYRIHSVANSNAAPTESTFLSINPTTAAATPIGGLIAGRVIRAATFDSADRLWVVDRLQNELLQIDPSNGQIVGTPVTITLNGNPSNIISDLAVRDDGTFIATDFTVGAVFYSLDIHTGVLTQIAADTALQATAQGSTRPTAFGIVAVGNIVFTYDAQGTDDIYKYDTAAGFSRSLVFANIVPSYNSGQGDLAIAAVNHLVTVRNVAPVIDTLSATSVFASGLVHLTGTYHDDGSQDTHSLTVDWGDGSPVSIMVPTAGLLMGTHVYSTQGNYTISVSLTDDDTGSTSASTSVVVVLGRSLSGSVYIDADNDGLRGIGESGLLGVQVQLNGVNDLGQSISVSTWTDIGGNYQFNQLRPGMYSLVEDQPAGYLDGKDTLGNLGLTSVNDQFFIDLSGEQDGSGYLFGELLPARLTGLVFDDTNDNGLFDIGEPGVPDAEVRLVGTNDLSEIVNLLGSTDANGNYRFENLRPGTYSIHNLQPGGYLDGRDSMGSLGGTMSNDLFAGIALNSGSVGSGYNFGEHEDVGLVRGQTATIGYWQNNNGQALIRSLNGGANSTALSNWLATNFSNMYGAAAGANNLIGKTNSQVADFYVTLFKRKGQKLDAQVLATALAVYVTDLDLAGNNAQAFGFTVTSRGTGAATYNVQGNGLAFGVANNTRLTIMQILRAANSVAIGGNLYGGNSSLRNLANNVFDGINTSGDI